MGGSLVIEEGFSFVNLHIQLRVSILIYTIAESTVASLRWPCLGDVSQEGAGSCLEAVPARL